MDQKHVCIIGGGASGMIAAIMAARNHAKVTVLEHNEKTGKKLLATGNGRCNLTNMVQKSSFYHSHDKNVALAVLNEYDTSKTLEFFQEIGILVKNKNGSIYPASMQASSVQELLELEARYQKVKIKCKEHVKGIQVLGTNENPMFKVVTQTWVYDADAVILACGSKASSIEGADGSGYLLAKDLGLKVIKPLPALVPLKGKGSYFSKWSGTRIEGAITLYANDKVVDASKGELQLTDYGISGIPVFQISSSAANLLDKQEKVVAVLDFLPEHTQEELILFLDRRQKLCPYKTTKELLIGMFPKRLIDVLVLSKITIPELAKRIKAFKIELKETKSFDMAQVCSGGVSLKEIDSVTMECKKIPGIYLAGELLDTDGICGGYNLQWAWSSGALAGIHAAKRKGYTTC